MMGHRTVLIAGCFDPVHEGHIDHIRKAAKLGDELVIITHIDSVVIQKKGFCVQSFPVRLAVLQGLLLLFGVKGCIVPAVEDGQKGKLYKDGIGDTLRHYKPQIFAKGGDRTALTLPEDEIKACHEVGCEIRYGVGDLLNSSSKMAKRLKT